MNQPWRLLLWTSIVLLASACSVPQSALRMPPQLADMQNDPSSFVVVTVGNEPPWMPARAGSTVHDYDGGGSYGVTSAASATVHALAHDYGLSEVSAWPINTLRVYCVVFRLPTAEMRPSVIGRLARDRRVESVQALNKFRTEGRPAGGTTSHPHAAVRKNDFHRTG